MQECTKNKQGKIGTNCQIGSFGTILVCTNYPMTIHNKVVHQLNPPSIIQHIKVLIEFHFLHKFCMETRCFLEKFTQLEKNLHDRWSQRSWQISSLCQCYHIGQTLICIRLLASVRHHVNLQCTRESVIVMFAAVWLFSYMLHAISCAFLEYLITFFLMLRYACIADNGLEFPQCVSKCAFSH